MDQQRVFQFGDGFPHLVGDFRFEQWRVQQRLENVFGYPLGGTGGICERALSVDIPGDGNDVPFEEAVDEVDKHEVFGNREFVCRLEVSFEPEVEFSVVQEQRDVQLIQGLCGAHCLVLVSGVEVV